jgi:hypothetical protein
MSITIEEVERDLIEACNDMRWREKQEGMHRLLTSLAWWLDAKGHLPESLTINGLRNDFEANTTSADALEHLLSETDCVSVTDLLKQWAKLDK